jgi:hypothetical protein
MKDRDVEICILPEAEKLFISRACLGSVTFQRVGAREAEMRERSDRLVLNDTTPLEDFFKLDSGFGSAIGGEQHLATNIDGIERWSESSGVPRRSQLVESGGLQNVNGPGRIVALQGELGLPTGLISTEPTISV